MTDHKTASVAYLTEEPRGEFYLMLGPGDHTCERWRLTPSLVRKLVREGVASSAFGEDRADK